MGASMTGGARDGSPGRFARLGAGGLVVLMSIGGFTMWIVTPVAWLWIGSQLTESRRPDGTLYVLVAAGLIVTMTVLGVLLGRLNRIHGAMTGRVIADSAHMRAAWHRPDSAADEGRSPVNALETIMVVCVVIAGILFFVWFFFFAGSSLDFQT
jgi:hypothetical protein